MGNIRLSNPYKVATLNMEGHHASQAHDPPGYVQFIFEDTAEVRESLAKFDSVQKINLRVFVDHLRKVQDQIRNEKIEGGNNNYGYRAGH